MSSPFQQAVLRRDTAFQGFDKAMAAFQKKARRFLTPPPRVVLVVDDEVALATVLARGLRAAFQGLDVATAHSVAGATTWLERNTPGVVVLDMHLGDGNGWELAKRLPRSVRLILMSGALPADLLAEMRNATAAVAMIEKPVEMGDLVRMVGDALAEPLGEFSVG